MAALSGMGEVLALGMGRRWPRPPPSSTPACGAACGAAPIGALAIGAPEKYSSAQSNIFHADGGWPSRAAFFVLAESLSSDASETLPRHEGLEARVLALVAPAVAAMGYEIVRVRLTGRERPTLQIMADRADGAPVGVDDCEAISRTVSAILDVEDPIKGAYTLEVSSPGIDRPLTRAKDWVRWAGHAARIEMAVPIGGRKRFSGTVLGLEGKAAKLRLDDGAEIALPLEGIRSARLVLTDALIEATRPGQPKN
jgi:ribosome maturation factor RimP